MEEIRRLSEDLEKIQKLVSPLARIERQIQSAVHQRIEAEFEFWNEFRKSALELNEALFGGLGNLTELGWYISPKIVDKYYIDELAELVRKDKVQEFEEVIIKDAEEQVPRILDDCSNLFSERAHIFNEILNLYSSGYYHGLITLAYSQADGICKEIWSEFAFFDKDKENGFKLKLYSELKGSELNAINSILIEQLAVTSNELIMWGKDSRFKDDETRKSTFNRHKITHGHSINYGTKANAIRAIYLLDFLCYFIEETR